MTALLTPRWTALRPHPVQKQFMMSTARFNVVPAGRRSGKTEIAKRRLIRRAMRGTKFDNPRFFCAAPTRQQAKDIFWADLKRMIPQWIMRGSPIETDLVIRLITGGEIHVEGLDKPERIEGQPWDGGIVDELGNTKAKAWPENIRPALSDRQGYCDLIGVPEGRNHYYDLHLLAQADTTGTYAHFHWKSAEILPPEEIRIARADLDELTFRQEYEADFITFGGRAYYPFDSAKHVKPLKYDKFKELILCFDFNVAPGVAAICQEQKLPNGLDGTGVIGEVHIPQNSTTPRVCAKLIEDWKDHQGEVRIFGDATGGARGSAKVEGSDWDLIKRHLTPVFGHRLGFRVPQENPQERPRVNAVNSRLQAVSGDIRMMVDPKCKHVIKDFEGVVILEGSAGEIDKKKTPMLTHLTDAIGYYTAARFPIVDRSVQVVKTKGH